MKFDLDNIEKIARRVVNEPWGIGDEILKNNSESWAPYLRFLHAVLQEYYVEAVVECGVYMGTATRHMALADKDTVVIGVDRQYHENVDNILDDLYDVNVELIESDTTDEELLEIIPQILDERRIGLLFLDSTHDGETPRKELVFYSEFFDDECLVCIDDLHGPKHLEKLMMAFWNNIPYDKRELHFLHPKIHDAMDEPGFGVFVVR